MNVNQKIKKSLQKASGIKDPNLEFSSRPEFGDYTSNIAIAQFSNLKLKIKNLKLKTAKDLAAYLVDKLRNDKDLTDIVERIDVAGPGFINFHLSTKVLTSNLSQIIDQKENYGKSEKGKGKTVVVDYSAPNIAKPFGIGHLRSTIIGQALYNLYNFLGYKTIGDNHIGDWGTQFGKIIYMIDAKKLNAEKLTIQDLEAIYIEFHQLLKSDPSLEDKGRLWFKKLEGGDKYARKVWKTCIDISLKEFDRIYKILNVKIDFTLGESFYENEIKKMLKDGNIKKHLEKGENGALIINLAKYGIKVPLMFTKSDGTTTYATRDLATIKYRVEKWNPDIIIYEVSVEQNLHFKQLFAAARLLGLVKDGVILEHTSHGWYLGPDGKKFSTRQGKTIKLEEVLDEAVKKAKEFNKNKEISEKVGIGAIKYNDLMRSVQTDVVFDWDKVMNLNGNSGPYIQYTYARCQSVLGKSKVKPKVTDSALNGEELIVAKQLVKFPEIIDQSAASFSPNILCAYLYELASSYNTYYNKVKIIGSNNEEFKLALTSGVAEILKNGLDLLGIAAPEKM